MFVVSSVRAIETVMVYGTLLLKAVVPLTSGLLPITVESPVEFKGSFWEKAVRFLTSGLAPQVTPKLENKAYPRYVPVGTLPSAVARLPAELYKPTLKFFELFCGPTPMGVNDKVTVTVSPTPKCTGLPLGVK